MSIKRKSNRPKKKSRLVRLLQLRTRRNKGKLWPRQRLLRRQRQLPRRRLRREGMQLQQMLERQRKLSRIKLSRSKRPKERLRLIKQPSQLSKRTI